MSYCYEYPRPMVTVDVIYINKGRVLLIKRANEPFKDCWALPGGFVDEQEDLELAAKRELQEETLLSVDNLIQYKTYGTPYRDPRGHTISVVYYVKNSLDIAPKAADDAKELAWFRIEDLPDLAFDHSRILREFFSL